MPKPLIVRVFEDGWYKFRWWLLDNLKAISLVLVVTLPFACIGIGMYVGIERGSYELGGEWAIPFVVLAVAAILNGIADKAGRGSEIPIPNVRFTETRGDEVSVDRNRLPELLLWAADVEDYIERQGYGIDQ